jgi:acyl carrier protein
MSSSETLIIEVLSEIFKAKGMVPPSLSSQTAMDGTLGLESLDFAEMVIRLEEITGKDPFATGLEFQIRTIADLAVLYD